MLTILLRLHCGRAARSSRGAVLIADAALARLFLDGATIGIFRFAHQSVPPNGGILPPCDTKCTVVQPVWNGASARRRRTATGPHNFISPFRRRSIYLHS